jgi:hypothetical protein
MKNGSPRQRWLDLYLIVGAFLGALWLSIRLQMSETNRIVIGVVLLILLYIFLMKWLKDNEAGIMFDDREKHVHYKQPGSTQISASSQDPEQPIPLNSRRAAPIWLVALVSLVSDFFHRL